jgi:hypothetical protein
MDSKDGNVIGNLKPRKKPQAFTPFPTCALPKPVSTYIEEGAKALGCDASYIALPLLSALAGAIGNSRRIKLKETWSEPCVLWTAIVGDSGTMKSPAIDLALRPLRKKQSDAFRKHDKDMEQYHTDMAKYDIEKKAAKKEGLIPPEKPAEPVAMRYYCSDTTIEALAGLLSNAPRGLLLVRDELSGWLKSFGAYKQGKGGDDAKWLEMHRAGTLLVDRKSGIPKTIHISNAAVGICGGIQPGILRSALGTEHFENGLAARLLLVMPPRKAKKWTEADVGEDLQWQIEAVFEGLLGMKIGSDEFGGIEPVDVPLTHEGRQLWVDFYDFHAAQQAEISDAKLAAVWSKLEGYTARIALVIHCVRIAAKDESLKTDTYIDEESISAAATIIQWFGHEIKRIYGMLDEDEEEQDQRRLLELIEKKGGKITVRQLQRASRHYRESAEVAESALQELADIEWGRWESVPAGPDGGKPTRRFVLAGDNTPTANS